jgi:hypothetical protein
MEAYMKIAQSQVGIVTQHKRAHLIAERRTLEIDSGDQLRLGEDRGSRSSDEPAWGQLARASRIRQLGGDSDANEVKDASPAEPCYGESGLVITGDQETDGKLLALAMMVARLTGRPVYIGRVGKELSDAQARVDQSEVAQLRDEPEEPIIRYEEERIELEIEQLNALAVGQVTTEDGREISFQLSVDMERFAMSHERLTVTNEQLKDPLVLDLGPVAAQFTEETMQFDIDADGELDDVPLLDRNGGFLVIDRNGNGVIDDGTEVVGAISGDGFADLQALDEDGNMWIDENDEVFERLGVWVPGAEEGERELMGVLEAGVGAIYLGAVSAEFKHTGEE